MVAVPLRRQARKALLPFLGIFAIAYFAYHTVSGDRGLLAWWQLHRDMRAAEDESRRVRAERKALHADVMLLRSDSLDLDMLEERSRIMLNLGRRDEVMLFYRSQG